MGVQRPLERIFGPILISSSLPAGNVGNAVCTLSGAMGAILECTAASGSPTGTIEVQFHKDGDWFEWGSFEYASGALTSRVAGTTITLADGDALIVRAPFHAVRFNQNGGTSATVYWRTCEDVDAVIEQISGLATEAKQDTQITALQIIDNLVGQEYETVAASQTAQVLGATGATGDLINGVLIIPATTSPGNVLLLDNATSITIFAGGASSVTTLIPFFVPLGIRSVSGAWKLTTGANVSAIGVGDFT